MKRLLFALCCVALILEGCNGCKENDPAIVFPVIALPGTDSSYLLPSGSVPAAAAHNVLVEEFSGQSCSNCPSGHTVLDGLSSSKPGRINIVTMYANVSPQCVPPAGAKYDFRNDTALVIANLLYNSIGGGLPSAGVDRTPFSGAYELVGSGSWGAPILGQLPIADSINLGISSSYNATTGIATITDTVTYAYDVYNHQNVSIYIVEDGLVDKQEDGTTIDTAYVFNDVFQAMVNTAPLGDKVLDTMTVKRAGQVYWRKYTFKPSSTRIVNTANCRVVAFINNPGTADYRVLQSVQCRMVP